MALRITDRSFMGMHHHVSGSNFSVLSVNLIPVPLSLLTVRDPTTFSHYVNSPLYRLRSGLRTDSTDFITNRFF